MSSTDGNHIPVVCTLPIIVYQQSTVDGTFGIVKVCNTVNNHYRIPAVISLDAIPATVMNMGLEYRSRTAHSIFGAMIMCDGSCISLTLGRCDEDLFPARVKVVEEYHAIDSGFTQELIRAVEIPLSVMCGKVVIFNYHSIISTYLTVGGLNHCTLENFDMVISNMVGLPPFIKKKSDVMNILGNWRICKLNDSANKGVVLIMKKDTENRNEIVATYSLADGSKIDKTNRWLHRGNENDCRYITNEHKNAIYEEELLNIGREFPLTSSCGASHFRKCDKGFNNEVLEVYIDATETIDVAGAFPHLGILAT
jgi:hypothetical protein